MIVTTSLKADQKTINRAEKIAQELKAIVISRNSSSLSQLRKRHGDTEMLVVDKNELKYVYSDGTALFFHPSLARIRVTSMLKGAEDRLVKISNLQKGDTVLDCTTGLATDAVVLSFSVGETGKVVTVESSPVLYTLAREGLRNYDPGIEEIEVAMRNISVVNANHTDYLKSLPDKSMDIVYFDPMFRQADKTVALAPLRRIANSSPISSEAIKEAKRVANKKVIMREHFDSGEFERLGFELADRKSGSNFDYGVIPFE